MMEVDRAAMTRDNRQISIQLELRANEVLAHKGLTAVQAHMLLYILHHSEHGVSLTGIHHDFGYSMPALSSLIKRLREKGYVRVEHCQGDDRRKLFFGTEKGAEVQAFLDRSMCVVQDQLYDGFSNEDLCTLDRMQKQMLKNLSATPNQTISREASEL